MAQVNEKTYELYGFWDGKNDTKRNTTTFRFKVLKDQLTDGMYLQLLGGKRPLYVAVEYNEKKYKLGSCIYGGCSQIGEDETTTYSFVADLDNWVLTTKDQATFRDKRLKIIVLDLGKVPLAEMLNSSSS